MFGVSDNVFKYRGGLYYWEEEIKRVPFIADFFGHFYGAEGIAFKVTFNRHRDGHGDGNQPPNETGSQTGRTCNISWVPPKHVNLVFKGPWSLQSSLRESTPWLPSLKTEPSSRDSL